MGRLAEVKASYGYSFRTFKAFTTPDQVMDLISGVASLPGTRAAVADMDNMLSTAQSRSKGVNICSRNTRSSAHAVVGNFEHCTWFFQSFANCAERQHVLPLSSSGASLAVSQSMSPSAHPSGWLFSDAISTSHLSWFRLCSSG